jgi:hypothetical protein
MFPRQSPEEHSIPSLPRLEFRCQPQPSSACSKSHSLFPGLTGDYTYTFRFRNATSKRRTALSAATAAYPTTLSAPRQASSGQPTRPVPAAAIDEDVDAEGDFNYESTTPTAANEYCQCQDGVDEVDNDVANNKLAFGTCTQCQRLRHSVSSSSAVSQNGTSSLPNTSSLDCGYRQAGQGGGPKFLYGYVYFRQVPDESNRRGFFQKVRESSVGHRALSRVVIACQLSLHTNICDYTIVHRAGDVSTPVGPVLHHGDPPGAVLFLDRGSGASVR